MLKTMFYCIKFIAQKFIRKFKAKREKVQHPARGASSHFTSQQQFSSTKQPGG